MYAYFPSKLILLPSKKGSNLILEYAPFQRVLVQEIKHVFTKNVSPGINCEPPTKYSSLLKELPYVYDADRKTENVICNYFIL